MKIERMVVKRKMNQSRNQHWPVDLLVTTDDRHVPHVAVEHFV